MRHFFVVAAVAMLSACSTSPDREPYRLTAPFDEAQARRQIEDGANTLRGSAFLRQRGGGVVTCAGLTVSLVPATTYARQRIWYTFNSSGETGFTSRSLEFRFEPDEPAYHALQRQTKCDAQGAFVFERVADGEYYVLTEVRWTIARSAEGGSIMQRVRLDGGKTVSIIMSS